MMEKRKKKAGESDPNRRELTQFETSQQLAASDWHPP